MAHQVVLIVHHGTFPTDKKDSLAVIQHPHFIRGYEFTARLLVVYAETAASPPAPAIGIRIQCFLPMSSETYLWVSFSLPPR